VWAQDADCDVRSIKTGNSIDTIESNFVHLAACIRKLQAKLDQAAIPEGALMAFDLDRCPEGWEYYTPSVGRFILGGVPLPNSNMRGVLLPAPKAPIVSFKGTFGGTTFAPIYIPLPIPTPEQISQKNFLTILNLPDVHPENQQSLAPYQGPDSEWKGQRVTTYNLVPPYLALLYCKKASPAH